MKLTLTLEDMRQKPGPQYGNRVEMEPYDRVSLSALDGPAPVIAAALRGIADDIHPGGA